MDNGGHDQNNLEYTYIAAGIALEQWQEWRP
jgi:hypothetical protein